MIVEMFLCVEGSGDPLVGDDTVFCLCIVGFCIIYNSLRRTKGKQVWMNIFWNIMCIYIYIYILCFF